MHRSIRNRLVLSEHRYTIFFFIWMVLITFLSLSPASTYSGTGFQIPHLDKAVHFSFYCVAVVLGSFFLREQTRGDLSLLKVLLLVISAMICYGIIIEVLQAWLTKERTAELSDALANGLGALIGGGIVKFLFCGKRQLKWKI